MSEFNYKDILSNARLEIALQQLHKKLVVFAQITDPGEFVLESFPNFVALQSTTLLGCEQNLVAQNIIVLFGVFVKVSDLNALDIAV